MTENSLSVINSPSSYIGRFAPSPTGPLHMGSLVAALASFLDARAHNGQWLLRIEDLDPPREIEGASHAIIESLKAHGLFWDGEIIWQSQRHDLYRQAIQQLSNQELIYFCDCSRAKLRSLTNHQNDSNKSGANAIYPGFCRTKNLSCPDHSTDLDKATRIKVDPRVIAFQDVIQGNYTEDLLEKCGDFIVRRKDGLYAYQLAVVVDDADQEVTHIVRGSDLLSSTPRQIFLQQKLGYTTPSYAHIPLVLNREGQKLSKQNHAKALDNQNAARNLLTALQHLHQTTPPAGQQQHVEQILRHAIDHWNIQAIVA